MISFDAFLLSISAGFVFLLSGIGIALFSRVSRQKGNNRRFGLQTLGVVLATLGMLVVIYAVTFVPLRT